MAHGPCELSPQLLESAAGSLTALARQQPSTRNCLESNCRLPQAACDGNGCGLLYPANILECNWGAPDAPGELPPHLLESVAGSLTALARQPPSERPLPPPTAVHGALSGSSHSAVPPGQSWCAAWDT